MDYFDFPKDETIIQQIIEMITSADDIIVDLFAGSGTTGHATITQNSQDRAKRRYVIVQLPEPISKSKKSQMAAACFCESQSRPLNIAELTKERLRRAAGKIKVENPSYSGDLGFRVFKLDGSNIRAWNPKPDNLEGALLSDLDHIEHDRTEQDILDELLLKFGLDLCTPIQKRTIADKSVHAVGAGTLIACLEKAISSSEVEPLALGISAWHDRLDPAGESTVVFRDSAFGDDIAKTNLTAILEQRGLANVRSF